MSDLHSDSAAPTPDPTAEAAQAPEPDETIAPDASAARTESSETFRSGFACFVGRPNTGKSTLTNALVGRKVAITSSRPQTTRHTIRGVVHRPHAQLILVDTPGVHRPRTLLGERLNALVQETLSDVDVVGLCVPATDKIGPGDRHILEHIREDAPRARLLGIVTKTDIATKEQIAAQLLALSELLGSDSDVVPISSVAGEQLDVLEELLCGLLPEGPQFFPEDMDTDESTEHMLSELIREATLEGVRDELPHSIAVGIEEVVDADGEPVELAYTRPSDERSTAEEDRLHIHAFVYVERQSQKAIVIGTGASRLKHVRKRASYSIRKFLGRPVTLHLHVKVLKEWQRDPKMLDKIGF